MDEEKFRALLVKLDDDMEVAANKYELLRSRLILYFETRRCTRGDELADETINRVIRRLSEGETIPAQLLSGYCYGVAKFVLKEYRNHPDRLMASLDSMEAQHLFVNHSAEDRLAAERADSEQSLDCLDQCLAEISGEDQELIRLYYQGEAGDRIENRKAIASQLDMTVNNLRIRVFRIRGRLQICVESCRKKLADE